MKKALVVLLCLFILCSCSEKPKDNGFEIYTEDIDMSLYEGVEKESCFKKTIITEIDRCLKEGGSGVFYLGYVDCAYCQSMVRYLNEVALELGVTVYYVDAFDEQEPYFDHQDMYIEDLYTVLEEEDGEKVVYTPHVFTIINGRVASSQISAKDWDMNGPTDEQISKLKDRYRKMLKPFVL